MSMNTRLPGLNCIEASWGRVTGKENPVCTLRSSVCAPADGRVYPGSRYGQLIGMSNSIMSNESGPVTDSYQLRGEEWYKIGIGVCR